MGFFKRDKGEDNELKPDISGEKTPPLIEMTIDSVKVGLKDGTIFDEEKLLHTIHTDYSRVLILKEKKGNRYLPIWIGHYEAEAIAVKLKGLQLPRPMTHDFLCDIIMMLGATVEKVVLSELKDDCHYAKTHLDCDGQLIEIDCRPSDAVNVAVRLGTPIFVNEEVLNKAAVTNV